MAVLDAPPQREAAAVERGRAGVRAQRFLDVLQGAFQLTWERPEELRQAMSELSTSEEAKAGLRVLWEYLEALSPSLSSMCEVGVREGEGEGGAARQAKDIRKRKKRGNGSGCGSVGDVSEGTADEEETAREQGTQAGMPRADEAGLVSGAVGVSVVRGVVRAGVPPRSCSMADSQRGSAHKVLLDINLLRCIIPYTAGRTSRQKLKALGQVAVVCRTWREAATWAPIWRLLAEKVVPALWREEQGGKRVVGRDRLVRYGRMLVAEKRVWSEHNWAAGLEMHVEIFDRMDGLPMLSARGPVAYDTRGGKNMVALYLPGGSTVRVRGAPFSAASRDPLQKRFASLWDFFGTRAGLVCPSSLCVRVTVRDQRTGKAGLLWEEGWGTPRLCEHLVAHWQQPLWQQRLPFGTFAVVSRRSSVVGGRRGGLQFSTCFYVCPEPNQPGVVEQNRQYQVATGADGDRFPFSITIESTAHLRGGPMQPTEHAEIATAIRSVLTSH